METFSQSVRRIPVAVFVIAVCAQSLLAQTTTATLSGVVRDQEGGVIPGAKISVRHLETGDVRETTASGVGNYVITNLAIGSYTLSTSFEGFKTSVINGITLQVNQQARIDFTLTVGSIAESVSITEAVPLLATNSASVGQVVENRSIESLALNGRQFWQLVALVPGATFIQGGQTSPIGGGSIRATMVNVYINGSGRARNGWLLDGADIAEYERGGTLLQPNVDALQEFKVEAANMSAEYGHTPNAVSATLKSGTNEFHGSLFEFLRNDKADARNFFAPAKDTLRRNQWGFTFGGPIRKNKLFFFTDMESTRLRQGSVFNSIVPSEAMRRGDFRELLAGAKPSLLKDPLSGQNFPGNIIPDSRIAPQAKFFLKFMPLPAAANFIAPTSVDTEKGDIKINHRITSMDHFMARYSVNDNRESDPNPFPALQYFPLASRAQNLALSWTHVFNAHWLNEASFSYNRSIFRFGQVLAGTDFLAQAGIRGFEKTQIAPSFPQISISGFQSFQGSGSDNRPKSNRIRLWQYNENLSYTAGKHDMKFGAQLYHQTHGFILGGGQEGKFSFSTTFTGNGFGDYLLGVPDNVFRPYFQNLFGNYDNIWSVYWRDNYRVTPNLTFNLGLRWEYDPFFYGIRGQNSGWYSESGKLIIPMRNGKLLDDTAQPQIRDIYPLYADRIVGTDKLGLPDSIRSPDARTWAPRFGFAWRPKGNERFVVRGAYGIFFIFLDTDITLNFFKNPPFQSAQTVYNNRPVPNRRWDDFFQGEPIVAPNPNPGKPCPDGFIALSCTAPDLMTATTDLRQSYMQQWNFSLQTQPLKDVAVDLAYLGNKTTRVGMWIGRNDPPPGAGQIQVRRPWPQWGSVRLGEMVGSGNYHSLQAKVEKRFSRGFQMLASYAFSKCIDQGEQGGTTGSLLVANFSRSDFDIAHNLALSLVYEFPLGTGRRFLNGSNRFVNATLGGWEAAAIVNQQSGVPFTPTISGDRANTGIGSQRPNRLGRGTVENPTPARWFNADDFSVPPQYTYGNSGRNILNRDGLQQVDLTLMKRFPFGEKRRVEFRTEFFNLLNHTTFAGPASAINQPTAGRVTSTLNSARILQFALKFYF